MNRATPLLPDAGPDTAIPVVWAEEAVTISAAKKEDSGLLLHEVRSPYQAGTTQIRVLRPDKVEKDKKCSVVYVLPVEAGTESKYGDGLKEIKNLDLHNKYGAVFVAPTFSHLPWYADHPTKPEIRQESYFVKVVVPFIDKTYAAGAGSVAGAECPGRGRLLLGFSKSGWGAWSLLLRHPDLFHKAAAWDAPLMMDKPGKYGSGDIFGTAENFEGYRIGKLLQDHAEKLRKEKRLVLLGYGGFRAEHEKAHALMDKLKVAHEYRPGPARKHGWHSGWVKEAVELLIGKPSAEYRACSFSATTSVGTCWGAPATRSSRPRTWTASRKTGCGFRMCRCS